MRAQEKLVRYLGDKGKVTLPEVARIILQSETAVFQAICICERYKQKLDVRVFREVRAAEVSKATAMLCEEFIMSVHKCGVISMVEADSMLEPLHHHLGKVVRDLKEACCCLPQ